MTLKWHRSDIYSFLYDDDADGKTVLTILQLNGNEYQVNLECLNEQLRIHAGSMAIAEWSAVNSLYSYCNQKANYYHRIRDHLPSVRELAERAGI